MGVERLRAAPDKPMGLGLGLLMTLGRKRLLNADAVPEADVVLDLSGGCAWIGVIPCSRRVPLAVHLNIVVTGDPLPMTHRVMFAVAELFPAECVRGEVMIPFHENRLIAFG